MRASSSDNQGNDVQGSGLRRQGNLQFLTVFLMQYAKFRIGEKFNGTGRC